MERIDIDNNLFLALTEALKSCTLPVSDRFKARMADELTGEAMRMIVAEVKAGEPKPAPPPRKKRDPRKITKAEKAAQKELPLPPPTHDSTLPHQYHPSRPDEPAAGSPFGASTQ